MPAAAVIPAPVAYIKVVAVKKLVVESRGIRSCNRGLLAELWSRYLFSNSACSSKGGEWGGSEGGVLP